ncbi:MAG TPA: NAD+ synthase, partial [Parvularcula sp.]|nr:NAD+ synthase [Parvularcula sp.]
MPQRLKIALCQIDPVVGDIAGNKAKIVAARAEAAKAGANLAVFCELVICGYPPEDLVARAAFQRDCRKAIENLANATADGGPAMIVGSPWKEG